MAVKRLTLCVSLILLLVIMSGCSAAATGNKEVQRPQQRITISTSFYPIHIMTFNIVKDVPGMNLISIAPPQVGCLHDYQLTTQDLKNIEQSQILIINGAGMETYMEDIVRQLPGLKIVEAAKGMELLSESGLQHDDKGTHEHERDHEHEGNHEHESVQEHESGQEHQGETRHEEHSSEHEHAINAHVWVSISGAIQQVKNISDQLSVLDPAYADLYKKNGDAYIAKLEQLKSRMHQALAGIENKEIITFHEAFPYFAQEFGLDIVAVIQREPGSEPSAREIAETIELIREHKVKAIFAEPQYPALAAETIAKDTQAKIYLLDPAVTGELEPDAYLKAMEANLQTLVKALKE